MNQSQTTNDNLKVWIVVFLRLSPILRRLRPISQNSNRVPALQFPHQLHLRLFLPPNHSKKSSLCLLMPNQLTESFDISLGNTAEMFTKGIVTITSKSLYDDRPDCRAGRPPVSLLTRFSTQRTSRASGFAGIYYSLLLNYDITYLVYIILLNS
jgi:hypothetical protein